MSRVRCDLEERGPVTFHWPADSLNHLSKLDWRFVSKFDFDYATEMVSFDTAREKKLYDRVQRRLGDHLRAAICRLATTVGEDAMRARLERFEVASTLPIDVPGSFLSCPDVAFGEILPFPLTPVLPSFLCEIC